MSETSAIQGPPDSEFTSQLGMKTVEAADGRVVIELELEARHMSVAQRAHGGVLFTMLDTAMGRAGLPDDIGGVITSLLLGDNHWMTAQRIEVSGGMHL